MQRPGGLGPGRLLVECQLGTKAVLFLYEQGFQCKPGERREEVHGDDHARKEFGRFQVQRKLDGKGRQQGGEADDGEEEIEDDLSLLFQETVQQEEADCCEDAAEEAGCNDIDSGGYF